MSQAVLKIVSAFDRSRVLYAARLALASVLALAVSTLLGLQNAYWAAMTVWIVAQPTRGMMIERNFYRLIGTGIGTAIAFLVLKLTAEPVYVVFSLCLVIVVCTGIGNLVASSKSYGVLLIGYTMAIVILPDIGDLSHPHDLPWARVLSTVLGVLISMLVSALFAPRSPRAAFARRSRAAGADTINWIADALSQKQFVETERKLIQEIAEIEATIDAVAAGSPEAHKRMRFLRVFLLQLINAMAIAATLSHRKLIKNGEGRAIAQVLHQLSERLAAEENHQVSDEALVKVCEAACQSSPEDRNIINALYSALKEAIDALDDFTRDASSLERVEYALHRDIPGALRAALRTFVSFAFIATIWLVTGWQGGPYTLMGMAIFLTVFSTFPNPQKALLGVFYGTVVGTAAALICRWLMLEFATSYMHVLLILAPFIIIGALARVYPPTEKPAIDYGMSLFVTCQPMMPLHGGMEISWSIGWSMTIAIIIVIIAFRFIVPAKAAFPGRDLEHAFIDDLKILASGRRAKDTGNRLTRMLHRSMRLALLAGPQRRSQLETVVAPIAIAHAIRQLQADIASGKFSQDEEKICRQLLQLISAKDNNFKTMPQQINNLRHELLSQNVPPELLATIDDIQYGLKRAQLGTE
ncbi:FUSC family protein [Microvirga sp. W0021]|uniref:FUSC family protein n=1 Tax=Hohaiivirga grylli TaxID=3133970 RepID=A0ABV0BLW0_9HYPH